jgi:hypothetical protein
MKLTIRRNYELKAMFLKIKNGDKWEMSREMHSEFRELKGCTDINCQTMWVVEWGLLELKMEIGGVKYSKMHSGFLELKG